MKKHNPIMWIKILINNQLNYISHIAKTYYGLKVMGLPKPQSKV